MKREHWSLFGEVDTSNPNNSYVIQPDVELKAGIYSAQFSLFNIKDSSSHKSNPTAEIDWMLDGQSQYRVISLSQGSTISGLCNGFRIKIYDNALSLSGLNQTYTINVSVTRGTRSPSSVPPVFRPILNGPLIGGGPSYVKWLGCQQVLAATPQNIDIPNNIGINSVNVITALSPTETTQCLGCALNGLTSGLKSWNPNTSPQFWCPVSSTDNILILNNQSTSTYDFGVTFGIDG